MLEQTTLPCTRGRHIRCPGAVITGPAAPIPGIVVGCPCGCHQWMCGNPVTATIEATAARRAAVKEAAPVRRLVTGAASLSTTTAGNTQKGGDPIVARGCDGVDTQIAGVSIPG